jgi:hypothetical protein
MRFATGAVEHETLSAAVEHAAVENVPISGVI